MSDECQCLACQTDYVFIGQSATDAAESAAIAAYLAKERVR